MTIHRNRTPVRRSFRSRLFVRPLEGRVVPTVYTVTNLDDAGAGSLRQAVLDANGNTGPDSIVFDSGVSGIIALSTGELEITDDVAIVGPGAKTVTVSRASPGAPSRIFNIQTPAGPGVPPQMIVAISGLTIANGRSFAGGAGIMMTDQALTLTECAVTGNDAQSSDGGGLLVLGSGSLVVLRCTFSGNNSSGNGGAICVSGTDATVSVVNSTLTNNTATGGGGAIYFNNGGTSSLLVRSSTITGNSGGPGGGIACPNNVASSLTIESSIVSDNFANSPFTSSEIAAGNGTKTVDVSYSAIGTTSGFTLVGSNNLIGATLNLLSLGNYAGPTETIMPSPYSPVIDAGGSTTITTDQRGSARTFGSALDIGAVEVIVNHVASITRVGPALTNAANVEWTVTFERAVVGLNSINFELSEGSGYNGIPQITGVSGSGTSWTVAASTGAGAGGLLGLDFVTTVGITDMGGDALVIPFVGEVYTVDHVVPIVEVFTNVTLINDYNVGAGSLVLTAKFSEPMNTGVNPTFSFPNQGASPAITFASGVWTGSSNTTYVATFNVIDNNTAFAGAVKVIGAKDPAGNVQSEVTFPGVFTFDTANPTVSIITRDTAGPTNAAEVGWTVTFSEPVSGLTLSNLVLFNGGLTGGLEISTVSGGPTNWNVKANTGSGQGTLAFYINSPAGVTDTAGNVATGLPVISPAYAIDHVAPHVSDLTTNLSLVSDASVGPTGFQVSVQFSEPMDQSMNPIVSFPGPPVSPSIYFNSGVWSTAKTYVARFNVVDYNLALDDIDIRVTGGKDLAGNAFSEFIKADAFDLEMTNPIVLAMSRDNAASTNAAEVGWTVTFSEPVTGVVAGTFTLVNIGLSGSPAITEVTGLNTTWNVKASTGTGQGLLSLTVTSATGVTDVAGNLLAALPVIGPDYSVDHVSPIPFAPTTNTVLITDASFGPAGFQITVPFDEPMDQTIAPAISFPDEDPGATLSFVSGVWLDAKNYRATYAVDDVGVEIANIDVRVAGAKDIAGNVQAALTMADFFSIDTKNATVTDVQINDGAVQRSTVRSVTVVFSEVVQLPSNPADAFLLMGKIGPMVFGPVGLNVYLGSSTSTQTIAVLTFYGVDTEFASLKDGRYTLNVLANPVSDLANNAFDGNGDTIAGDDYTLASSGTAGIFRLYGDATGDGSVAINDFNLFRSAFGGFNDAFDFDNDGSVAISDFNQFRMRFGATI